MHYFIFKRYTITADFILNIGLLFMIKKILFFTLVFTAIFSNLAFANKTKMLNDAFNKFSTSPFNMLFVEGGALFTGDGMSEMPLMMRYTYNKQKDSKRMDAVDGMFGSLLFDLQIHKDMLTADVVSWNTNFTANINNVAVNMPIINNPKIYTDVLSYVFIDSSRRIREKTLDVGKSWNTLTIGYVDRVDTIVYSAKSMRVRTYTTEYYNNKITIDMSSYTNIGGIDYPMSFVLKSREDKREIHLSLVTVVDKAADIPRVASSFMNY